MRIVNAQLVANTGVFASSIRLQGGRITEIGGGKRARDEPVVDLDGDYLLPGLINAHDHLHLNHLPQLRWSDRYADVADWIDDVEAARATDPRLQVQASLWDRLRIGAMKNLLSGATTVCHHDPFRWQHRLLPVHVAPIGWSHSLGISGYDAVRRAYANTPPDRAWVIHLAEGSDHRAATELEALDRLDALRDNTVLVHGVGLSPADIVRIREAGAGLVWCPGSNDFLLGQTIRPEAFRGRIALGTDSRLTGSRDLLEELKAADAPPPDLFRMVTCDAASLLRLRHRGRLRVGYRADLICIPCRHGDPFRALTEASRSDLRWVVRSGRSLVGDARIFDQLPLASSCVKIDGQPRRIARSLALGLRLCRLAEPGVALVNSRVELRLRS